MNVSDRSGLSSKFVLSAVVAAIGLLMFAGQGIVERYYVQRELEASERRAAPYLTALVAVLERYQNIPPILSEDQDILNALLDKPAHALNAKLARFSEATGADAVYLMNDGGLTIAASNWRNPKTFLGQNYGFRPYFREALSGRPSEFFAVGVTTGEPGYFVSHPVRGQEETPVGVIAVKVDLRGLERDWETPEGTVFISNKDGVVVLSEQADLRFRSVAPLPPETREEIAARRQFGSAGLEPMDLRRNGNVVSLGEKRFVEHTADIGRLGWKLHFLSSYSRVRERSRLVLAVSAVALSLMLAFFLFRRWVSTHGLLVTSQRERDTLDRLNQDLAREIRERTKVQTRLQKAQQELKQTSKLAALGQLATSVSHELGQPLSAMKTYIAGARLPTGVPSAADTSNDESDEVYERLDRLVDRMSETTRQLKFFARRGGEAFDDVNLADVIAGALETMRPAIRAQSVELECVNAMEAVIIRGGRMRLEQVLINVIGNALDAMSQTDDKELMIILEKDAAKARIRVLDTGEGLSGGKEINIFEPFVTTKASGEGLGLGLAISAGIVGEHGGTLSARNRSSGGAEFILELPMPQEPGDEND